MANSSQDLELERSRASFHVEQLTHFLDGSREATARKDKIRGIVQADPLLSHPENTYFLSRTDQFKRALSVVHRMHQIRAEHNLTAEEFSILVESMGEIVPTIIQEWVFIPCLKSLCSPEQLRQWLPLAERYAMLGCYAQTELSHGSNVQGLETTATFIKESDEFELHSPTITSTKWWVGMLGKVSTHSVVFARLIIDGKDYGPHAFMVQIRSMEDHKPLPGIIVGDIGPKFGFNTVDNGFLRLDHVRIPRSQMLNRFAQVTREGKYIKTAKNDKAGYGSMVAVRTIIVLNTMSALAKAATVAVRYSAVRRQFPGPSGKQERPVLDYSMQQYRVLPYLAACYAFFFTAKHMEKLFKNMQEALAAEDYSLLPEAHAVSSGLKSLATNIGAEGIEVLRRACGGHGYSKFSALPDLYGFFVHMATAEGENYLLTQQTTRYLLKALQSAQKGNVLKGDTAYLQDVAKLLKEKCAATVSSDFLLSDLQLHAYRHRSARILVNVAKRLQEDTPKLGAAEAWNAVLIEVSEASKAHCMYVMIQSFVNGLAQVHQEQPELYPVLKTLCDLFALFYIEKDLGEFVVDGYMSEKQVGFVREQVRGLLAALRPNAVALVDAFNLSDVQLNSALGKRDGNVYATMYEWASQKEPLNQQPVVDGYEQYLKPLIRQELYKNNKLSPDAAAAAAPAMNPLRSSM